MNHSVWADSVTVSENNGHLKVLGSWPISDEGTQSKGDLLSSHQEWLKRGSSKDLSQCSGHLRFVNANSDRQLIDFVARFGPVGGVMPHEKFDGRKGRILVTQPIDALRRDREIFAAAAGLVSELNNRNKTTDGCYILNCMKKIAEETRAWVREYEEQRKWLREHCRTRPNWRFDSEFYSRVRRLAFEALPDEGGGLTPAGGRTAGHQFVCELLNAFPIELMYVGQPIEVPSGDGLLFGIRPVLYFLLRLDYMKHGLRMCKSTNCGRFFEMERSDQEFCTPYCSRLQRQRDYYHSKGAALRRERLRGRKSRVLSLA